MSLMQFGRSLGYERSLQAVATRRRRQRLVELVTEKFKHSAPDGAVTDWLREIEGPVMWQNRWGHWEDCGHVRPDDIPAVLYRWR